MSHFTDALIHPFRLLFQHMAKCHAPDSASGKSNVDITK